MGLGALTPGTAAIVYLAMVGTWTGFATLAFTRSLALPLSEPFLAGLCSMAAIVAYRLVVTDRGERLLRSSFALYLAPQVIDKMLASKKLPVLGGETRDVQDHRHVVIGHGDVGGRKERPNAAWREQRVARKPEQRSERLEELRHASITSFALALRSRPLQ